MKFTCAQGQTWDSICYQAFKNEMLFPEIIEANPQYSDVVIFDGGEVIDLPENIVIDNMFITKPFETGGIIRVIQAPWE